ncbi:GNAT family N-acetyltransferase [Paludicola sp. MB14-C6]|uniref:GNAT family N-acetyltransferase n=1 Tax=Paludihabitans sp. MB14-C6 TaxID=3070656 RepID=UPI0027DCCB69|nr:GNAT family N-acetyltransferase [Paludicola sp. MB14-C6]WMJ22667.1 GNAT family N-acetyltransferase [Paludicola sp. MB14-C6]
MKIKRLEYNSLLWEKAIEFAENCSWIAGKHIAGMLRENRFFDWEAFFVATEGDNIIGYCSFLKEDYYPENRYFPWISSVFVDENMRGHRVSHKMIETAIVYAKEHGFTKVYIPSDMKGFYEKCGFRPIDKLKNYGGDIDTIFIREI